MEFAYFWLIIVVIDHVIASAAGRGDDLEEQPEITSSDQLSFQSIII